MRSVPFVIMIALAAACAGPQAAEDEEAEAAATAEAAPNAPARADDHAPSEAGADASGMIHNTPEGGVLEWVADIEAGLDSVPRLVGSDPAAAQGAVLNLYVMRQEYLEGYYGEGGRLESGSELAGAIDGNEARFHALMAELSKEAPDSAAVGMLTDSLEAQTARVRTAAESVGRELTPWQGQGQAEDG